MKILALEFSSPQRSVAVVDATTGSGLVVAEITEAGAGGMRALGMVEAALREARLEREQIECLAVGLGPGSYTGIRAAISLAQGWQLALGVKLAGVGSADAIAAQAQAEGLTGKVSVIIDAQRDEFYIAGYELSREQWRVTAPLRLAARAEVVACAQAGDMLIGPEITRWFPDRRVVRPTAARVGQLAWPRNDFTPGEKLEPIYLRATSFVKAAAPRTYG